VVSEAQLTPASAAVFRPLDALVRQEINMATIEIEGKKYKVTETIRASASNAETVKFVSTPDGERVAVMRGGAWVWRPIADKLQPRGSYVGMSNAHLSGGTPSAQSDCSQGAGNA